MNKRKILAKDSVNTIWWFSKTENPKAGVRRVLVPYSEQMQELLRGQDYDMNYGKPGERPRADENIARVPLPQTDPVFGKDGPLLKRWPI